RSNLSFAWRVQLTRLANFIWQRSLLFLPGPVTEEQIVKVRIINFTLLVTENLLTHRLINVNVCMPDIVVLLIWLIQYSKQIHHSLDNFRTGENSNLESCFLDFLLIFFGQFLLILRIWGPRLQ